MSRAVHASGRIWAIFRDGSLRHAIPSDSPDWLPTSELPSPIVALATTEDNSSVFAACRDGSLHLFHAESTALIISSPSCLHAVPLCLLPLPLENALFVGLQDGAVVRCHLASLAFDCMLGCGVEHSAAVNALEADELYLYSGGEDSVILVWDLKEANAVREISMPAASIRSMLRVDVSLWVGEADGTVEVFDIFGDDSNGIERTCKKCPHAAPVTNLIKVGECEVWSLSTAPPHSDVPPECATSVAIWDTRDLSFEISDAIKERDLMSVTVVNREPFEEVTVLALTNALGPQLISKNVHGMLGAESDVMSENYEGVFSDLEIRLEEANEELFILRSGGGYRKGVNGVQEAGTPGMMVSLPDGAGISAHSIEDRDVPDHDGYSLNPQNGPYQGSPLFSGHEGSSFTLSRSVSETLLNSLQRMSELLVTLLTEDVLSPAEGNTNGSNEDLRSAVATITRELNIGRQLIESCTVATNSDNSIITVDENELHKNLRNMPLSFCDSTSSELRKKLDVEIESRRRLEKDLTVVSKERDLLAEDLDEMGSKSDNTMAQLQGIIRDKDANIASRDEHLTELQNEYKRMEGMCQLQVGRREEVEKKLKEDLSKSAKRGKTFEEKLGAAYDKIETQSIQIQSQHDSLRASEFQIENLKKANRSMENEYRSLDVRAKDLMGKIESVESVASSKALTVERQHQEEVQNLKQEQAQAFMNIQAKHDEAVASLQSRYDVLTKEKSEVETAAAELRDGIDLLQAFLQETASPGQNAQIEHKSASEKVRALNETQISASKSKISELELRLEAFKAQKEMEVKMATDENLRDKEERDAKIEKLEGIVKELQKRTDAECHATKGIAAELLRVKNENSSFQEEITHRTAAAELYEKEAAQIRLTSTKYRLASEELESALSGAEHDIEHLQAQLEELRQGVLAKGANRGASKQRQQQVGSDQKEVVSPIEDSKMATKALLASANGEIEQMSAQLEAMYTAHFEQEKELTALRAALESQRFRSPKRALRHVARREDSCDEDLDGSQNLSDSDEALADSTEDSLVNVALQEIQEGMVMTQDKVRLLTRMARRYRESAQSHLDVLPALAELEAELNRISKEEPRKASKLATARGVVQSVIALYFSTTEKRAAMKDYDEIVYAPSSRRLAALQAVLSHMRARRATSQEDQRSYEGRDFSTGDPQNRKLDQKENVDSTPSPRRLLTY